MSSMKEHEIIQAIEAVYQDYTIREREYYPDFRRSWDSVLRRALDSDISYLPDNPEAVLTVEHSYCGLDMQLHFDQLKMADWYERELKRKSQAVFVPKKLKRTRSGVLSFHDSLCHYDANAPESALTEDIRNIIACALPALPPELQVVYGNKWVNSKVTVFKTASISLLLLNTDYVPAFLGSPLEIVQYLFLMDCCIIKENYQKVKDADLKQFLHIFKPSPMLKIKGLLP